MNAFADIFAPDVIVGGLAGLAAHVEIRFFPVAWSFLLFAQQFYTGRV